MQTYYIYLINTLNKKRKNIKFKAPTIYDANNKINKLFYKYYKLAFNTFKNNIIYEKELHHNCCYNYFEIYEKENKQNNYIFCEVSYNAF